MISYRKELWFEVPTRRAFINITGEVQRCVDESGVREGLVLVNAKHISFTRTTTKIHCHLNWLQDIKGSLSEFWK